MSSSPSTRFTGVDIKGKREDELPIPDSFLQTYAETKAMGEKAVTSACSPGLLTVNVGEHWTRSEGDELATLAEGWSELTATI